MIFPRLEYLKVWGCKKLPSAPSHFPSHKELIICRIRGPAFEKIISELTTLTSLEIWEISELACLPEHFLQKNGGLMGLSIRGFADLESIFPHGHVWPVCTSLRSLYIEGCDKLSTMPDALHNLHCLEDICVNCCRNLRSFPSMQGIASLQRLRISCSDKVLPTGLRSCISLQHLSICNCPHLIRIPDLREWYSLTELIIGDCSSLIAIPDLKELPSLTRLVIWDCSNMKLIPDLKELSSLTKLAICGCHKLISIPDIRELHSLTQLEIRNCQKLRCLPDGLDFLPRLKRLEIGGFCQELDSFPSLNSILHSLEQLHLYGWASLNSLPKEIQCFTALQTLKISGFGEMNALPEWLGNLSSLQRLYIDNCKKLIYLPKMQAMQCLIKLSISNCPKLKERCAEGSGAEWSKIAHIPKFNTHSLGRGYYS